MHDTELEEFCQEFGISDGEEEEDVDFCHFPLETTLDFDQYVQDKDPDHILAQIVEVGQISLLYDLLEHITHNTIDAFSGMILLYAERNDDGSFLLSQDVMNSRSGIADRQSCVVRVKDGLFYIDRQ